MKRTINLASRQQGMTSIGWLFVISIIGFFALLVMVMLPIYMGNMEVRTALNGIAKDPEVHEWKKRDIRISFGKKLMVSTWSGNVKAKDLNVIKHKDGTRTLQIDYQTRENFMGNVYITVEFSESIEIPRER